MTLSCGLLRNDISRGCFVRASKVGHEFGGFLSDQQRELDTCALTWRICLEMLS
uniref:Uncharacterized protein n=1 Tax=Mesocestoides corti TaxID=53468 RepID=A0A5K3EQ39_MESCO